MEYHEIFLKEKEFKNINSGATPFVIAPSKETYARGDVVDILAIDEDGHLQRTRQIITGILEYEPNTTILGLEPFAARGQELHPFTCRLKRFIDSYDREIDEEELYRRYIKPMLETVAEEIFKNDMLIYEVHESFFGGKEIDLEVTVVKAEPRLMNIDRLSDPEGHEARLIGFRKSSGKEDNK
jgi:hypothetical protein